MSDEATTAPTTDEQLAAWLQEKAVASAENAYEWAVVEVFGHRRHVGRIREEERFGAKMLRIDVPNEGKPDEKGWTTHWYGGASIFSLTLTDEATALKANKPYESPGRYLAPPDDDDAGVDGFEDMP